MSATSDFAAALSAIDPDSPTAEFDLALASRTYMADRIAELPAAPTDPDTIIVPHFIHDGLRTIAKVASWLGEFYGRHKATIDPFLETVIIEALTTLMTHSAELRSMNNRGPT